MAIEYKIVNPLHCPNWNESVASNPKVSIFHTANWARVLVDSYGYGPRYFAAYDKKTLLSLIPIMEINSVLTGKRGVSLPFSDYCAPLLDSEDQYRRLFSMVKMHGREKKWKYIEFRGGETFLKNMSYNATFLRHKLNLSKSEKEIFSKFRKGTKSSIKKAVKEGVNVIVTSSLEGIKEFYKLNIITRKKHGMPPQPYIFFENIYKNIIEQDLGIIVLSTKAEKVIAGAVFFYFGDEAFYKYSASDPSSVHLSPNNVVMWEAIKWFNNRGFTSLCFGRSESSNLGLIRFKSGWGTEEAHLKYYRFDITKGLFIGDTEGHLHTYRGIFKKMPALILTAIGNFSYRHMG